MSSSKRTRWADDLENLSTLDQAQSRDLKYDNGRLRVWLSRRSKGEGEPFDRTIYVDERKGTGWVGIGSFDGDTLLPSNDLMVHPSGTLGDAWNATSRAAGMALELDYPDITDRLNHLQRNHGTDPPDLT